MIGQTVWLFDGNRRQYDKQSRMIYRAHFLPVKIVSETPMSWVCERDFKINKKTRELRQPDKGGWFGWQRGVCWSEAEVDDACFVNENRHIIADRVGRCHDVTVLKQIGILLESTGG